jgi:putative aldouronate transport system substrate-binding protein
MLTDWFMRIPARGRRITALALLALALAPGLVGAQDLSKRVELQFYMLGDAPKDLALVQGEINKMALKDINATVKFNFIPWANMETMYNLLLASGQTVDLLYAANWCFYGRYAEQGAFLPLDGLIQKAAPELYAFVPKDYWKASSINGKMYGVPATWKEYTSPGFFWREDLRKKYNLPVPDSLEHMEAYCDGIRKYEPNMIPISPDGVPAADFALMLKYKGIEYPPATHQYPFYGMKVFSKDPANLQEYFYSKDFIDDAAMFKRWADKGFWPKGLLSQTYPPEGDSMLKGVSAIHIAYTNAAKWASAQATVKAAHPDWDFGWLAYGELNGAIHPAHATQNLFVVPKNSANPERALMFYQRLVMDKRYNQLSEYGIEGKHYRVTSDGWYEAIDPKTSGFAREGLDGWAWRNPAYSIYEKPFAALLDVFKKYDKISTPNFLGGFSEDPTPYQSELAAFNQVWTQYGIPIIAGLAGDPQKAVETFRAKAKEAGIDKIRAEQKKQWLDFLKRNDIR